METKTEYVTEDAPGQAQRRIFAVSIAAFNVATGTMGTTVCAFWGLRRRGYRKGAARSGRILSRMDSQDKFS